jgi:hypothetical protein
MLDHVSITVSDISAAERFYDAIMKALEVVKVGRRDDWLGYGERARAAYPERVYLTIRKGAKPDEAFGRHWCFKAKWRTQVDAFWDAGVRPAAAMTARRVYATITLRPEGSGWQPDRSRLPSTGLRRSRAGKTAKSHGAGCGRLSCHPSNPGRRFDLQRSVRRKNPR